MDDDEAEEKSKAIIEKLKGVLKHNVENKLTTASPPGEQTPPILAALPRAKGPAGKRGSVSVAASPFGFIGQGLAEKPDSDFQLQPGQ